MSDVDLEELKEKGLSGSEDEECLNIDTDKDLECPSPSPVKDTGFKPVEMSSTPRSNKRKAKKTSPYQRRKKPRNEMDLMMTMMTRQEETMGTVLSVMRELQNSVDSLREAVNTKIAAVDTRLDVLTDRVKSLQEARADGFITGMGVASTSSTGTQAIPHYVAQTQAPARPASTVSTGTTSGFRSKYGFKRP
ncbi:MAG: hypothetical protein QKV08_gp2 [Sanya nyamivirus 1]|uniref:Uncharacterized protein n=1 Tax=Sanya nyamivirus 1 TaxID=2905620 RepID=A0A8K1XGV1_9MONO|nr:MAG: hypothetical protein QKV08_gp2 [Sanya nyamivirus 1]UHM27504.1 MAG: hypothetical protein SaNyV1_gp2 [Sanya nyamivirus 1]